MSRAMLRLPGETRLQSIRRRGTYEKWRDKFTQWIIDEGRTHSWVAAKTGYSCATVQLIAHALEIFMRAPSQPHESATVRLTSYTTQTRVERAERRHTRERSRVALPPNWELPRTIAEWRAQELMYARLRREHGGQCERGWWGTW